MTTTQKTHRERIEEFGSRVATLRELAPKKESNLDKFKRKVRTKLAFMADSSNYSDKEVVRKALEFNKIAKRDGLENLAAETAIMALKSAYKGMGAQSDAEEAIDYTADMFKLAKEYRFSPLMIDAYESAKKTAEVAGYDMQTVNEKFGIAF